MNYTLLPLVKSPHQFVAQGVEEMRVFNLDHLDRMGSAAQGDDGGVGQGDAASVGGEQEVVAAAADV